jgi:hypothetical protein
VVADEAAEVAVADGLEEGGYFLRVSSGKELDAAIREVTHPAGDVEPGGNLADAVSEAHALDAAFVKYLAGGHWGKFEIRNQNGAKRHRPAIFISNKRSNSKGMNGGSRRDGWNETGIRIARASRAKSFEFLISNFEFFRKGSSES